MDASVKKGWFTQHRRWEDYASAVIGVLILLSPILVGASADVLVVISAGLAGVLITMLALLETLSLRRWEEILELLCGLWVVAAPLVLGYGGLLASIHFVLGGLVCVLALHCLIPERKQFFFAGLFFKEEFLPHRTG